MVQHIWMRTAVLYNQKSLEYWRKLCPLLLFGVIAGGQVAGWSVWDISTERRMIAFEEVKEDRLCLRCRNKGRSNTYLSAESGGFVTASAV